MLLCVTGCVSPQFEPAHAGVRASGSGVHVGPFAPVSLRVHPLTHLERNSDGTVFLLTHIQLRDRWSDICKGVGTVQLFLYKPTGLGGSGQETQELQWDINLYDLDQNALFFDPATETYRFSLGQLPEWVEQMVPGGDKTATGPGRFRIVARLTTPTPEGGQAVLVDELVVGR